MNKFQNPNITFISRDEFLANFKQAFDGIFSGLEVEKESFKNRLWQIIPVPYGLDLRNEDYHGFECACKHIGDMDLNITGIESVPPHLDSFKFPLTQSNLRDVWCNSMLGHIDCAAFGKTGKWGAMFSVEGFGLIGGESSFIQNLESKLGGKSEVEKTFISFANEIWGASKEFKDKTLNSFGWLSEKKGAA
ncbi:MAG: hypothetical protein ACREDS_05220 [Limisphaerales bacterium]